MADAGPDGLMSAPPGVAQDAGSANTSAATIEAAKAIGMAHVLELSQDTLAAGVEQLVIALVEVVVVQVRQVVTLLMLQGMEEWGVMVCGLRLVHLRETG